MMENVFTRLKGYTDNMKIALYGISRVGKDTLINKLITAFPQNLTHVKGSSTLKILSKKIFNQDIDSIAEEDLNYLRIKFVEYLNSIDNLETNIIVDGHFSFPNKTGEYNVVFTQSDLLCYDLFIYYKRDSKVIMQNARVDINHKYYHFLEEENSINAWVDFEISSLKEICELNNKQFIVIDDDFHTIQKFFSEIIYDTQRILQNSISYRISTEIMKRAKDKKTIILTDCDKTISITDPTLSVIEKIGVETSFLKAIFKGDYYTIYQFFKMNEFIDQDKYATQILEVSHLTRLNNPLVEELIKHRDQAFVVGVTTGLASLWSNINKKTNIFDILIGFSGYNDQSVFNTLVTPQIKGDIMKNLVDNNYHTIAIGDSIIDSKMIEIAHQAYIVCSSNIDLRLQQFLKFNSHIQPKQFEFNSQKYDDLEEVNTIWLKNLK